MRTPFTQWLSLWGPSNLSHLKQPALLSAMDSMLLPDASLFTWSWQ